MTAYAVAVAPAELLARRDRRRLVLVVPLAVLGLAACAGLLTGLAFDQRSLVKWAATVVAPAAALVVVLSRRPATYLAGAVVLLLPFLPLNVSVGQQLVSPVAVLLGLSVAYAFLAPPAGLTESTTGLHRARLLAVLPLGALLCLTPSVVRGLGIPALVGQVALVAGLGYLLWRAQRLDRSALGYVSAAFLASVSLQGALAINEFRTGRTFNPYGEGVTSHNSSDFFGYEGLYRPSGGFFDPISLGNVLALAVPLGFALACSRRLTLPARIGALAACLISTSALVLTFSRMSWIAATLGLLAVLVLSRGSERVTAVVVLATGAAVVGTTAVALAGDALLSRFRSIFDPTATGVTTAAGDETRQQLWHASLEVFAAHPVVGIGAGRLHAVLVEEVGGAGLFGHAHSTYFQTLAEAGLVGGLFFVVLAVAALLDARRGLADATTRPYARAATAALVALAVCWLTDYTVRYSAVLACMSVPVVLLALSAAAARVEPSADPRPTTAEVTA